MKKATFILLFSILVITSACMGTKEYSESDTLTVGIYPYMPPYQYYGNGNLKGFEIELISEIAKRMNKKIEFVETNYKYGNYIAARSGTVDVSISAITKTASREKDSIYSELYMNSYSSLLCVDSKYSRLADFEGKKIGIVDDTVYVDHAESYKKSVDFEIVKYYNYYDLNSALLDGEVDGAFADYFTCKYFMKNGDNLTIIENTDIHYFGMVSSIGNEELINDMNEVLRAMYTDGSYEELRLKYFEIE
ncbi:polar amino acid transport system substrate-binding protein [Methanococcus maripaludis]|uniref:Polar amino acid transport system substrate-binding protein n=1 Tax=Methanococcus maripaludis TaxID=39152 RepID=A0A7J9PTX2_METMI|nr:ABC transporter substrate-binding protein [Methanococcus maripaludis]MBA2869492.1 polar amino acid transport system substrate-binding protein [Methanococcus maripaludis]MBB6402135.1 polar amino acid transport system substrate-binding protein [Methanococcus maripaludis]